MCLNLPFHHIGIACYNIEASAQFYVQDGYTLSPTTYDPIQNVNIAFLSKPDNPLIELISPHDETSPVNKNLQKNGVSPYHICYETADLEETILELKKYWYSVNTVVAEVKDENAASNKLFIKEGFKLVSKVNTYKLNISEIRREGKFLSGFIVNYQIYTVSEPCRRIA